MSLAPLVLALSLAASGADLHAPHDSVYSVATASLPGGLVVTVAVGTENTVLATWDDGLHWQLVAGAGLELQTPWEVVFHPGLPSAGGSGLFVIGTENGAWTWDPVARLVAELSVGLAAADRQLLDLEAPLAGSDGPVIALSANGGVYLLAPGAAAWQRVFQTGPVFARRGDVALTPQYDAQSAATRARDLWVAASGRLWVSRDGGQTWQPHASFSQPATSTADWMITTIALAEDYRQSGAMMMGRGRVDPQSGERGEIRRSLDGGQSFSLCLQLPTAVMSLAASPPGPGGARSWFAAGRAYPDSGAYQGTGILISTDQGATWDDFGNHQDFLMEDNPGRRSGNLALNYEQEIELLPDWSQRGALIYGRQEGLFISQDRGAHWVQRQMRVEREFRDLETAWTRGGERAVFGAGYGVGTMLHLPDRGYAHELPAEPQMIYTRRLDVSPNFAVDGNLLVAGNKTLWAWQSDEVSPANPQGAVWWWQPENRDPQTQQKLTGFPRVVEYSPRFDGRGSPGSDRTFFWNSWDFGPYRSEDNGATAKALHAVAGGGLAPEMSCFAIAPTYDAGGARTDAYAAAPSGHLYRLVNEKWQELGDLGPMVMDLEISPAWSRPAEPVLFAALSDHPYVLEVRDDPGGVSLIERSEGLPPVCASGLALHPEFAQLPVLFLATFGSGVWRLDLATPQPRWLPVGLGFPALWAREVALSPNFADDGLLYVATQDGIWECEDAPGSVWRRITTSGARDDGDESFQYYQPADPSNPSPTHAWPWNELKVWGLPAGTVLFGEGVRYTLHDQSWLTTNASCRSLEVASFAGNGMGSLRIEAFDYASNAPLGSAVTDLGALGGSARRFTVPFDLGQPRDVRLVLTALLDPGEVLLFDAIEFRD